MSSSTNTAIILLVTVLLLLAGGGAFMYMSQDDDDDVTGSVAPVNVNNDLPRTYPVSRDPSLVNRDCEVEVAVYRDATGTCKDSDGNVLTGEEGRCGGRDCRKNTRHEWPRGERGFRSGVGNGYV